MINKRISDKEVIKALECCNESKLSCSICPLEKECDSDPFYSFPAKYALEVIKRLQRENKILSRKIDTAFQNGMNEAQDLYKEQIEHEIKVEAYKEFAEALKKRYDNPAWYLGGSNGFFDNLDSFVKEMAGAENDA